MNKLAHSDAEALVLAICPRIGSSASELVQACRYLPLALRLSAALLDADETRTVACYLTQLEAGIPYYRIFLLAEDRDELHILLPAVAALSYAALPDDAQQVFAQLGVFAGSFDLSAALAVIGYPLYLMPDDLTDTLDVLVRRSLLDYDPATARYRQHELLRDYGRTRLTADTERVTRLSHARYYANLLRGMRNLYQRGKEQIAQALALFDQERQQTDAVWQWLLAEAARGPANADLDQLTLAMANVTAYTGELRYSKVERIPQLEAWRDAARRLDDKSAEGSALNKLGSAHYALGDARRAIPYHEQALVISRVIGDWRAEGHDLSNLGNAYKELGEIPQAIRYYQQALELARAIGDRQNEAIQSWNLGLLYEQQGDLAQAAQVMQVAAEFYTAIGHAHYAQRCSDGVTWMRARLDGLELPA